jgi:hypothetical protein
MNMTNSRTILSLFKDQADEMATLPLLAGIPGIIRLPVRGDLGVLEDLRKIGIEPSLVIISRRLYPEETPEVVDTLKRLFPAVRFLLIASSDDPFPPLRPLITDQIRHLTINPFTGDDETGAQRKDFVATLDKLAAGRSLEIADYLDRNAPIHECAISSSGQKEELITAIMETIPGDSSELESLRQRGALLADEMLENAMYGAPRGEDGRKLYRKGEERTISPREGIVFRFGFDGQTLALEVADSWGSLSPDQLMEHLARNHEESWLSDDAGGRGLFIIWRFLDQFHVNITPGRETVVGGQLTLSSPLDPEAPKGFYISTHC